MDSRPSPAARTARVLGNSRRRAGRGSTAPTRRAPRRRAERRARTEAPRFRGLRAGYRINVPSMARERETSGDRPQSQLGPGARALNYGASALLTAVIMVGASLALWI